jgi:hypothetical protein
MMNHLDHMQFLPYILVCSRLCKSFVIFNYIFVNFFIEQRLRDKNSNSTIVQASYDGLAKPLQSNFDGNERKI